MNLEMEFSILGALIRTPAADDDTSLVIELVFEAAQIETAISSLVNAAVPDTPAGVEAAFDAGADRFIFATVPLAKSQGFGRTAF